MSVQPQHTLRHNPKHYALHVNPLLTLCIDPLHMLPQPLCDLLFLVRQLLDQFKEEMTPKVPQNVFE